MSEESETAFGIVDVVEAFTAMRHELKLQSKEGRKLVAAVEEAVARLETALAERSANREPANRERTPAEGTAKHGPAAKAWAETVAELDETVQRSVAAAIGFLEPRRGDDDEAGQGRTEAGLLAECEADYRRLPAWRRWAARPLYQSLRTAVHGQQKQEREKLQATLEGLRLMQQRVARVTADCQIERVETLGQPFDPNKMNALEAVPRASPEATAAPAAGEVVEQLRPAYYWGGNLLRYAQVRIAR
jgi:molecular chaperone GrpE